MEPLLLSLSVPAADARACAAVVLDCYAQENRAYHNLAHIHATLATAATMRHKADDFTAVQLALWFHDVIYDPQANDNEAQSAAVARDWLGRWPQAIPAAQVRRVEALIMATQHHQPTTADGRLVVDADLAILAAPAADYSAYAQAIRREYAWVAEEAYRHGRGRVLAQFLARPHIYHLPELRAAWETAARENLRREIEQLGGGRVSD